MTDKSPVEPSSGNVFADLGLPDADRLLAEATAKADSMKAVTRPMLDLLWHTLGMTKANHRKPLDWWLDNNNHRNLFCIGFNSLTHGDGLAILQMERLSLMVRGRTLNNNRDVYFHATAAGVELARREFAGRKPWLAKNGGRD